MQDIAGKKPSSPFLEYGVVAMLIAVMTIIAVQGLGQRPSAPAPAQAGEARLHAVA